MRTPWKPPTDLYEPTISSLFPFGHVNPIMDIEIIAHSYPTTSQSIKCPYPSGREQNKNTDKNISPFHLVNFSSSQLTRIVTLFIFFNNKNVGRRAITS
jgi:hypothetical protein